MANVKRHPRYLEGSVRLSSLRICEANASGHDLIGCIDEALVTLYGMRQCSQSLYRSVSLGPFVRVLIREYEDIRSRLTPLGSGVVPRANEMELLKHRLDLIQELLDCLGGQRDAMVVRDRHPREYIECRRGDESRKTQNAAVNAGDGA